MGHEAERQDPAPAEAVREDPRERIRDERHAAAPDDQQRHLVGRVGVHVLERFRDERERGRRDEAKAQDPGEQTAEACRIDPEQIAQRLGTKPLRLTPEALDALARYDFPGNVRQLENEIERLYVVLEAGASVTPFALSPKIVNARAGMRGNFADSVRCYKAQMIEKALRDSDGNRTQAARSLGLERSNLVRTMRSLGIHLFENRRFDEAEPLLGEAFETQRRVLGAEDPETLRKLEEETTRTFIAKIARRHLEVRVLLVEDGADNRRLITYMLEKANFRVSHAENGEEAVAAALAALDADEAFDVILMDMQMPVLDGYEATRQLRERDYEGGIIALTAHAMKGDRQKCLAAGCDEFATKPIDRRELLEKVISLIRKD